MGTVCSSAHLRSLVAVYVGDGDFLSLKALGLNKHVISICKHHVQITHSRQSYLAVRFNIEQKVEVSFGGLDGPANFVTRSFILLANGMSANTSGVLGERNSLLEFQDILQVGLSLRKLHAFNGIANFTTVLVVDSQMVSSCLGRFGCIIGFLADKSKNSRLTNDRMESIQLSTHLYLPISYN